MNLWVKQRQVALQFLLVGAVGFIAAFTTPIEFGLPGLFSAHALMRVSDFVPLILVAGLGHATRQRFVELTATRPVRYYDLLLYSVLIGVTYALLLLLEPHMQVEPEIIIRTTVAMLAIAHIVSRVVHVKGGLIAAALLPVLSGVAGVVHGYVQWWAVPLADLNAIETNVFVCALVISALCVKPRVAFSAQLTK
ncbi:hypothetical protein [Timonella sp. A28]|uniref:hypothetical protein n=1 Tax=Timonella sp. A28 TaxID=3442640 RepID=UPI003EBC47D7